VIYCVKVKVSAAKALKKIAIKDRERLIVAIDSLSTNLAAGGVLKGEFSGLRRLRVGDYRIVYEVNGGELIVLVIRIGHRQGVYR
jgi:mRNA interferase RelE/StbE